MGGYRRPGYGARNARIEDIPRTGHRLTDGAEVQTDWSVKSECRAGLIPRVENETAWCLRMAEVRRE